jgi:basic amino acid/polyamine antiporter, APA family
MVPGPGEGSGLAPSDLRRSLGLVDAVGIGFGAVVGAGIFVVTGVAAGIAGPAILPALLLAGAAATANALSSAQLAASFPRSGGTYEYGNRVLGPVPGFAAGWLFLASKTAAAGTVALGLAGYLEALVPGVPPRAVAVGGILVFTALNYLGVRRSSRANLAIVAVSLTSLLLLVAGGALAFDPARLRPFAPGGWGGTMEAAALLFFAYTGYARIATLGEEVRDPARTIPRAAGITVAGAILLYLAVAAAALGAAGAPALADTAAPLEAAARAAAESTGLGLLAPLPVVVALGGLAAMLGVILSQVLGLSRMVFAMARGGDLPGWLQAVHATRAVPHRAVLVVGAVAALVAGTGTLAGVAAAASFAILAYYGIANVAALRMPAAGKLFPDAVPVFGLVACTTLALSLELTTIVTGLGVLAAGFAVRFAVRRAS